MSRGRGKRRLLLALCLLGTLLFSALGAWQVERRAWKLDLIERVEQRVDAAPEAVPPAAAWRSFDAQAEEYRRVRTAGTFLHEEETLVEALTERGPGYWVLTPLRTPDGLIMINRGFVPPERRSSASRAAGQIAGEVRVTGLIRPSEPDGRVLRPNRPAENRWFSRDIPAIAKACGVGTVAPFFIDADAAASPGGWPIGGMTVVQFRNTHLVYALTWFGLAALCIVGLVLLLRGDKEAKA